MITQEVFYKLSKTNQHKEFEKFLEEIIFNEEKRKKFYIDLIEEDYACVRDDIFRQYFEEYSAERKSNQQDYTPEKVSELLQDLTNNDSRMSVDYTAGTGTLLCKQWEHDRKKISPFEYYPSNYFYGAWEKADNCIPYLIHNMCIRGVNGYIVHGDTLERNVKQIYFIQNINNDLLGFSNVNVMPHNEEVKDYFRVNNWLEEEIDYKENSFEDFLNMIGE